MKYHNVYKPVDDENEIFILVDVAILTDSTRQKIQELSNRFVVLDTMSPENLKRAHVILTAYALFDPNDTPNLRWVQIESATIAHLLDSPVARGDFPLANVRGAFSPSVAELAIGILIALKRRFRRGFEFQSANYWAENEDFHGLFGDSCYGSTLGIVGYGSIGRHAARIARSMGMEISACNSSGKATRDEGHQLPDSGDPEGEYPSSWYRLDQLDKMFPCCDSIIVCLPLTKNTHHAISMKELECLPPHSYIVDVGRGGVIDLEDLLICLRERIVAGAGIDVSEHEPLPADSPLWGQHNLMIFPHIGSGTKQRKELVGSILVENLARFLENRQLMNVVDFERGY